MKTDYYLKKGDIVICKKTLKRQEGVKFIKNKHCKITDITTQDYEVDFYMFSIITKKDHYNFNDSFFTFKDYRKEKLKKLNESWR
jgi:hypothetical protein